MLPDRMVPVFPDKSRLTEAEEIRYQGVSLGMTCFSVAVNIL